MKPFIAVVYAERVLYNEVFLKSRDIHKEQYGKAENILNESLKSPNSFRKVAEEKGMKITKLKVSRDKGFFLFIRGEIKKVLLLRRVMGRQQD